MTIGKDRNTDQFKNWQLCGVWKPPFRDHRAIKLTQNCLCFTNPCINSRAPPSVTGDINTTPRYLNVFTCCSVLLLTCSLHCLGFVERHHTPVFLVLIFSPARSEAEKNWSSVCWRPCWKDATASSTKSSAKIKRFILHLPTVTPSSTRLSLSIQCTSTMIRNGDSTHPCRSPKPTVNGRDLALPTRKQTSEQECSDLTL